MKKVYIFILLVLSLLAINQGAFGQEDVFEPIPNEIVEMGSPADSINASACTNCTGCSSTSNTFSLPFKELPFIILALTLGILLTVKKYKYTLLFWSLALVLFSALIFNVAQNTSADATHIKSISSPIIDSAQAQPQASPLVVDDLENDEFADVSSDENFETWDETQSTDTFTSLDEAPETPQQGLSDAEKQNLLRTSLALLATLLAGFAFRSKHYKIARYLLLLIALIYLGFYSGGCPCMISSFQNLVLMLLGEPVAWLSLVWIVGLLLLTYFFGKIWCGWVCHLGALQEFIFRPNLSTQLLKPGVQTAFKVIQWTALAALLIQLIITRTNLFIKIDPFKVAFNLFSSNTTGYVLLAIMLISSLFIYRPFCRAICPVGLVLGWVTKVPKASKLSVNQNCKSCKRCQKACSYQAIENKQQSYSLINEECIRCGHCIHSCGFDAIKQLTHQHKSLN